MRWCYFINYVLLALVVINQFMDIEHATLGGVMFAVLFYIVPLICVGMIITLLVKYKFAPHIRKLLLLTVVTGLSPGLALLVIINF